MKKSNITKLIVFVYVILITVIILIVVNTNTSVFVTKVPNIVDLSTWNKSINGTTLELSTTVDEKLYGKSLVFRTSSSFVYIQINDIIKYNYGEINSICKTPGSAYQMFHIDPNIIDIGDTITITISTVYDRKFNPNPTIYVGDGSDIVVYMIGRDGPQIMVIIITFVLSIVLMAISTLYFISGNVSNGRSVIRLSMVLLFMSIWSSFGVFVIQFIIRSGTTRSLAYFISMQIIPIFIVQYVNSKNYKIDKWSTVFYVIFIIILNILQITGIKEFEETLMVFIPVALIYIGFEIVYYNITKRGPVSRAVLTGIIVLFISICITAIQFLMDKKAHVTTISTNIGTLIYVVIIIVDSLKNLIAEEIQDNENRIAASLSKTDTLTGVGNRFGYNSDIKKLHLCDIGLVSIDLNNLKYYNDTKGHAVGDKLLIYATYALVSVFGSNAVYRIGGDEFIAIYPDASFVNFEEDLKKLDKKCRELEEDCNHEFILEIACGIAYGSKDTESDEELLRKADAEMYKAKRRMKESSRLDKGDYKDDRVE